MPKEFTEKSSNSELVQRLIEILKEEASLFDTFLELLEQQQKALVKNDIEELNKITERQREKIIESRILAKKREKVVEQLDANGNYDGNITVSQLINTVSGNQALMLGSLRDTILDLNDRINRIRTQNEMLISRSRENIMKTMELLGQFKAPNRNYQSEGKIDSTDTNVALDRRA